MEWNLEKDNNNKKKKTSKNTVIPDECSADASLFQ